MPLTWRILPLVVLGLLAVGGLVLTLAGGGALGGWWTSLMVEAQTQQRELHRGLAGAMRAIKEEGVVAAWGLITLSFLYGVFHAAGPGHGKVVISTYLLTQESHLRRGIALSLISSLVQGISAILLVEITVQVLGLAFRDAQGSVTTLEAISFGLVALVGAYLIYSRGRQLLGGGHAHSHHDRDHSDDHGHNHDDHAAHCGHSHGPSRSDIEKPVSLRALAGIILSIGIRPCSGAVLVLLAAHALDLRWAGILGVLAMSIGTGLAVSLLATLSVYARQLSLRLSEAMPGESGVLAMAVNVVGVIGGIVILLAGLLLLQSTLSMPAHPLR